MSDKPAPPLKAERKKCWDARDLFWKCLDENGGDSGKCKQWRKGYEEACPASWVTHFDRKWKFDKYKQKLETEGYEPITDSKAT
ncbi:PREDICTED: cytochrome c oxidase assembly factor 6 homolog [Priapulus caudatus]|uniref:Cytochrome c oxidase assembly factor 6 homolog n=1 Tax=Priapulus caudatus TaxID=37621 RepID=A0ABM1DPG1_PRICU|nr:PREDICTED: cytochrome c oxidase assembly factor 6 homolog [Priapulus caudatus]